VKTVRRKLKDNPRLQVEFLPPYTQNLNLIERFRRFVKDHLVKNTYYETFIAIAFQLLNHVGQYVDELKTLIVEKLEIIVLKINSYHEKLYN
jgi:transposase